MKYQFEINEKLLNRIISVAYGDANIVDKIKINVLALRNPEIKRLLAEYKITARSIGNLEKEDCPDEILENIKINTGIKEKKLFSRQLNLCILLYINRH